MKFYYLIRSLRFFQSCPSIASLTLYYFFLQDVLLYNFFGSTPMKNKWRVVYEYMNEQGLLDGTSPSFPNFDLAKHNVLCSELKQLYVAITRTRQRLWICENIEAFSKPMFDYWKKKGLVQVRKLDDSLAQAMQVASSPEEWKSRGYKVCCLLFFQWCSAYGFDGLNVVVIFANNISIAQLLSF